MSARTLIVKALADKFRTITTSNGFNSQLYDTNVSDKLKFWDECNDFPFICVAPGTETREYHPAGFKWGFFNISIKAYVKSEDPAVDLENLIEDIEKVIDANYAVTYDTTPGAQTTEIRINSIITDEGLLAPYGVGEVNISVQYQVL